MCVGREIARPAAEPLDLDPDRDDKRSAAGRAVCNPAHRFWHVALAAVHLAALVVHAAQSLAVVVLVGQVCEPSLKNPPDKKLVFQ